jgi:hypothetical protein
MPEQDGAHDRRGAEPVADAVERRVQGARAIGLERQCQLDGPVGLEVGERDADQREAPDLDRRCSLREQPSHRGEDRVRLRRHPRQGVRPSRPREVVEAQPQNDRAADATGGPVPPGQAVDEGDDLSVDGLERPPPPSERALRAQRAPPAAHLHGPRVAVVRQAVEVASGCASDDRDESRLGETGDLLDGRDPEAAELAGGDGPHPPEPLDREAVEKRELELGRHDQQAVGFGHAARDLGEELGSGDADRDREPDALADVEAQPRRDLEGRARDAFQPADVEERLVDRQALHQRRRVVEDREDRLARLRVGRHPGLDHDRVRAQPAGLRTTHCRADAVRLGLVAGREHDPGADDDGPPAQPGVVALLDRRVERVEVGVQNRGSL